MLVCGPLFIVAEDYETFDIAEHKNVLDERIFIIAGHTARSTPLIPILSILLKRPADSVSIFSKIILRNMI